MKDEWLTEKQVTERFPISASWLRKLRRPGEEGPVFYKKNPNNSKSPVVYKLSDVEKWWGRSRVDPSAA